MQLGNFIGVFLAHRWSRGSVLAFSTEVCGFKPGRSRRIFRTICHYLYSVVATLHQKKFPDFVDRVYSHQLNKIYILQL